MKSTHSLEDLLDFLSHAGERGLMPAATAQALAVAARNVFSVLDEKERSNLPIHDLDGVIQRFTNKRKADFNPSSLKEYSRRVRRAVELHQRWQSDPAAFSVKTRTTTAARRKERGSARSVSSGRSSYDAEQVEADIESGNTQTPTARTGYQSAFPVRAGHVVVVSNIPYDLSASEADRLAQFIRLLAPA
jgi:hypothetical protein